MPTREPPAIADAVALLTRHNEWRRGADIDMAKPSEIGRAIDLVCAALAPVGDCCPACGQQAPKGTP